MGWTGIPENERFKLDRCIDERVGPDQIVALARGPWGPDGCAYYAAVKVETPKETAPYIPDADGSTTVGCVILYDCVRRDHHKEHLFKVVEETQGPTRTSAPAFVIERLSAVRPDAELEHERDRCLAKWVRKWRADARANTTTYHALPDAHSRVTVRAGTEVVLTGRMKGFVATFNGDTPVKVFAVSGDNMVLTHDPDPMVLREWRQAIAPLSDGSPSVLSDTDPHTNTHTPNPTAA